MKRKDISTSQVIAACLSREITIDALMNTTGAPYKVALSAIMREVDKGTISYGVAPEYAFVIPSY